MVVPRPVPSPAFRSPSARPTERKPWVLTSNPLRSQVPRNVGLGPGLALGAEDDADDPRDRVPGQLLAKGTERCLLLNIGRASNPQKHGICQLGWHDFSGQVLTSSSKPLA
ncbi:predicted protein [Histoplasma capsulatum H143]|uniref:Uncharacterized protein n=1 Tax=Ajellomyces capsulatus (strain H143) TaxID=544712 RepID=C6HSA2_AJECH|nr:predicted protein [Histoplasma capsulatum H143]